MKMRLLLFVSMLIGSIGLSFLGSSTTYAQSSPLSSFSSPLTLLADSHELDGEGEATENPATSCAIDGIGWIICPVVRTMASVVDGAYAFVSSLLVVQPLVSTGEGSSVSVYNAWTMMRNLANVAFVIAFLIIIFSQLTSVGLNNYGIKKMLPRLIVAAILVNVSFWICAIAVDISNIAGSSLNSVMQGLATQGDCSLSPAAGQENTCLKIAMDPDDPAATGTGWAGIAGLVIAGGVIAPAVLYATLSALLPALLAAVVAIVTVFLVLTLRQALIILLIIISPLAFVAYLLPNTEQLFKKWMAMFKTLLLMYPIIAMIFGASALASTIVMNAAPEESNYRVAIQIMGALISIIPLALTPVVMKTAGGVLNRFGGIINNPNKGPVDKLRKKAEGYRDRRQALAGSRRIKRGQWALGKTSNLQSRIRGDGSSKLRGGAASVFGSTAARVASSGATSAYDAQQKNDNAKRALADNQQDYVANRASNDNSYAASIAGSEKGAVKLQASALEAVEKRKHDEVKAGETLVKLHPDFNIDQSHLPESQRKSNAEIAWEQAVKDGNETLAQASQNIMVSQMGTSGVDKFKSLLNTTALSESMDKALRTNIAENHTGMKGTSADLDAWAHSDGTALQTHTNDAGLWRGLSDAHIASQTPGSIASAGTSGGLDAARASSILGNDRLNTTIKGAQKAEFQTIIGGAAATGAAAGAAAAAAQPQTPTVNIPPQPTQAPTIQYQAPPTAPGTLNIQHTNMPPNANPANSRTSMPPNTGNFPSTPNRASGLYAPNSYQQNPPQQPPSGPNPPNNP